MLTWRKSSSGKCQVSPWRKECPLLPHPKSPTLPPHDPFLVTVTHFFTPLRRPYLHAMPARGWRWCFHQHRGVTWAGRGPTLLQKNVPLPPAPPRIHHTRIDKICANLEARQNIFKSWTCALPGLRWPIHMRALSSGLPLLSSPPTFQSSL